MPLRKTAERHCATGQKGFTLMEAIIMLVLVGLLAGAIMTQMDTEPYDVSSEAAALKTALRYAQTLSFGQAYLGANNEILWGLNVTASSFTLVRSDNTGQTDVNLPGETSPTYNLPDDVNLTAGTVYFNFRGIPSNASGGALTADTTFTVSAGVESIAVTVTQQTGFVQ